MLQAIHSVVELVRALGSRLFSPEHRLCYPIHTRLQSSCLHVVVALHEVGGLALAVLGVAEVAAGGRAALFQRGRFIRAVARARDRQHEVLHRGFTLQSLHLLN